MTQMKQITNFETAFVASFDALIKETGELLFGTSDAESWTETAGGDTGDTLQSLEARERYESTEHIAAEIMAEVFDRDTLEKWSAMDAQERMAKLELLTRNGDFLILLFANSR